MKPLIKRLFSKNEIQDEEITDIKTQYLSFLKYFYNKGRDSNKLKELVLCCDSFSFDNKEITSQYQLLKLYLDIEYYLIIVDGSFIQSKENIRKELQDLYPVIAASQPFTILFEKENIQELKLASLLSCKLYEIIKSQNPNLYVESPEYSFLEKLDILKKTSLSFISSRGKIIKYITYLSEKNIEAEVQIDIQKEYKIFKAYFENLKCTKELDYYLPCDKLKSTSRQNIINKDLEINTINSSKTIVKEEQISNTQKDSITHSTILENILDKFILFAENGTILKANSNALKYFELDINIISQHSLFDILPLNFVTKLKKEIKDIDHTERKTIIGHRQELELKDKRGGIRHFEITITNNYTNTPSTYSLFLKNVTQSKKVLTTINTEKENAERTAQVKSTFLSNMSHEIRTPLNVILGLTDIIKKGDNDNKELFRKNIEGIDFSAKNLLSIVNDILDFSKIEAGKLTVQAYDFNIKKILNTLIEGFAIKAREKGVELTTKINNNIPDIIVGDQYRLNQIMTNLIGNALKFTESGSIEVIVELKSIETGKNHLYIEVKDTGIGISEEKLSKIFDSFYQVEGSEKSKINGTGLGLAITKQLIELQNGVLQAKSTPGKGSTFYFCLPFEKSSLQYSDKKTTIVENDDSQLEGLRVLIAEDNKMNQFYIQQLLNRLGIKVDIAENGKEAVDMYNISEKRYYDLILMDMHMPIMNGSDAIIEIRNSYKDSLHKVPIVMCSADVFPETRKNAIRAGIDFYLTKPLSEDALKEVLFWLISDNSESIKENHKSTQDSSLSDNVNLKQLKEDFDGDESFIISLLEIFIKETPDDYNSLQSSMKRGFFLRAGKLAHKMKSSFMNLGMTNHGYHLQQIESNIDKPEKLEIAKNHWKQFQSLYTKALLNVNLLLIELKKN